ncbi:hypothetical protein AJ87_14105 [Rhizobium yanglingense]|nr:hypothetical protein AJ87_14105 [Rhizobium yanglingense]
MKLENSDKGYEVGGLAIWYHPFRLDIYPGLREKQLKNLRTRLAEDRGGRDIPDSAMQDLVSSAIREDDAKRRPGDSQNVTTSSSYAATICRTAASSTTWRS